MTNSSLTLSSLDAVYITIEFIIGISATVGNILVIWVVKLNPAFQTNTFYFIVSLALADIAVGILVMPLAIVVSLGVDIHFYSCLFMCCLMVVFTNASILSLLAIAIDRYLRVKLPTRYRIITTKRRIWVALGICWLLSLLTGFVPMFGWNKRIDPKMPSEFKCKFTSVMSMDYMVYFNFFAWILIPLILMCALYIEIFYIIRTKLSQSATNTNAGVFYGKEFKAAKSLALVLFLFAICWLPLSILNCIGRFCLNCQIPSHLLYVSILLSHSNSVMNPVVYACKIKKFKDTYTLILRTHVLRMSPKLVSSSMEQTSECDPVTP
ncbi:adenosine receptor A3 [Trachemys scripta elegans]|uniref:adenosine receptor A3 n=1 Tax=Trachemys scripta elegans TaxID=31138 RepID=UPI000388DF69|nr:adenosine receptor A3 [Chrysemys picta bellii]XP_034624549.1 adenosine receptor A3 [Trachemys scripta elegans]